MKKIFALALFAFCTSFGIAQVTLVTSGNWSNPANWDSGYVPTMGSDVIIPSGKTDSVDISNAVCKNITISGNHHFARTDGNGIKIHGNIVVNNGGRFRMSNATPTAGAFNQTVEILGDLTVNSGGTFDMRQTSGAIGSAARVVFSGSSTSTINLSLTSYTSGTEEFNSVTINKTGGAKVILNSGNLFISNNSTNFPDTLTFVSGMVETGSNRLVHLGTAGASVTGSTSTRYVNGFFGRGMSTSAGANRYFDVGDANGFRPISVRSTKLDSSGGYVAVRVVSGDANNSSSFVGGIDQVSSVRYYEIIQVKGTSNTNHITVDLFAPSYGTDDNIANGSTDLRVAYSTNNRSTWNNMGQTVTHTTDLSSPPKTIVPDALSSVIALTDGGPSVYVALANVTGGASLPVELTSFSAVVKNGRTELNWVTAAEVNNAGFEVEKLSNGLWSAIGFVEGNGTSNREHRYSFVDAHAKGHSSYRLKQIDRDGKFTFSSIVEATAPMTAAEYSLSQNYPNPFNPSTKITFAMQNAEHVSVTVFNALGQTVETLFNGIANPNEMYTVHFNGKDLASGVYYYSLRSASRNELRKMLLMK